MSTYIIYNRATHRFYTGTEQMWSRFPIKAKKYTAKVLAALRAKQLGADAHVESVVE